MSFQPKYNFKEQRNEQITLFLHMCDLLQTMPMKSAAAQPVTDSVHQVVGNHFLFESLKNYNQCQTHKSDTSRRCDMYRFKT